MAIVLCYTFDNYTTSGMLMLHTHKAISQLQKEIRDLRAGIVSVEALIVEKQKTIESLQMVLNEQQVKVINNVNK